MRRRLDLAASLITKPALIFLDEPTTGLDPRTRGQMWETIRGLVADGCTILLTTQYLDEADELADRIAVIDRGRKVAEGTPDELKAQVGGSMIRVQLAEGVDASAAAALAEGVARHRPILTPTRTGFSVSLTNANQAADILIALRTNRIDIENAAIEQPSLDEVFMALTGNTGNTGLTSSTATEMSEA
jgi:ABC-2 type transport system ATP-binding protein